MRRITVPLSAAGLNKAAEWLEDYAKRTLPKAVVKLVSQMVRAGETWAVNELSHIDTGETRNSIHGIRNGNKGVIVAGGNAIWIEFGTGVVSNPGSDNVHPNRSELAISDWGTYVWHGNLSGLPHGANPKGWWYMGDDGELHHTYGIPMNPFMYDTAQALRKLCPEMAKEIFDK